MFQVKKVFIKIFFEYLNYINIFIFNFTMELVRYNNKNNNFIMLIKGKPSFY